jgi:hypothetical protein
VEDERKERDMEINSYSVVFLHVGFDLLGNTNVSHVKRRTKASNENRDRVPMFEKQRSTAVTTVYSSHNGLQQSQQSTSVTTIYINNSLIYKSINFQAEKHIFVTYN